jgi:hypothetical protein
MTPFPTLRLDHNNQALTKGFAYQGRRSDICVLPKPKSQATWLKYANEVMTSRVGRHYQPTLWDALKACACPRKLTLLASSFGIRISFNSKRGVRFWFGLTQGSSICPMPFDNPICTYTKFSWYNLLEAFISLATWCGTFYVTLCPTKKKVMSSSRSTFLLCRPSVEFFYGFLGMLHVGFIHPIRLYWMVSFPLN